MGYAVTLAAVPLDRKQSFLEAAGIAETTRPDAEGAGPVLACDHRAHFLIWRNLRRTSIFRDADWQALSHHAPVMVLDVVDTAGAQVLRGYEDGEERWEVSFLETNETLLAVRGTPPRDVAPLRERLRKDWLEKYPEGAAKDEDDLIAAYGAHLPAVLFEDLTGLHYENSPLPEMCELSGDLTRRRNWRGKPKHSEHRPWWKIW